MVRISAKLLERYVEPFSIRLSTTVPAFQAFEVLTSHALQVATINSLGDFILFLGKCFVTAVTGVVGLALFRRNPELSFYAAPTLLVCIFAFFVAHCVLSLYEVRGLNGFFVR